MGFRTIDLDTEEGMKRYNKLKATNSVQKAFEDDKEPFIEKFAPRPEAEAQEVKDIEEDIERSGVVKGVENLRVRKAPGGEVIMLISENSIVDILGEDGDWYFVRPNKTITGYVMKKFIQEYTTGG